MGGPEQLEFWPDITGFPTYPPGPTQPDTPRTHPARTHQPGPDSQVQSGPG